MNFRINASFFFHFCPESICSSSLLCQHISYDNTHILGYCHYLHLDCLSFRKPYSKWQLLFRHKLWRMHFWHVSWMKIKCCWKMRYRIIVYRVTYSIEKGPPDLKPCRAAGSLSHGCFTSLFSVPQPSAKHFTFHYRLNRNAVKLF